LTIEKAHDVPVRSLVFQDGKIASGGRDGALRIWSGASGEKLSEEWRHGKSARIWFMVRYENRVIVIFDIARYQFLLELWDVEELVAEKI
jgi:hypothetical protein